MTSVSLQFWKFEDYLPIFEHLTKLISIRVTHDVSDEEEENFAESFLSSKTEGQQDLVIRRLSKVKSLLYTSHSYFCPNAIKFIANYLTGLEDLNIRGQFHGALGSTLQQQQLLIEMISCAVKADGIVSLYNIKVLVLAEMLPTIAHILFSRSPYINRVLQISSIDYLIQDYDDVALDVEWWTDAQVNIWFFNHSSAHQALAAIFDSQFSDVDEFVFCIMDKAGGGSMPIGFDMYDTILEAIPSLKKVTFDIPASFTESESSVETHQYPSIELLTLRYNSNVKFHLLLDRFAYMFPNLKCLNLYYYEGVVNQDTRDLYIDLAKYTLECLAIDLTPVRFMMNTQSIKSNFFIVQVESSEKKDR